MAIFAGAIAGTALNTGIRAGLKAGILKGTMRYGGGWGAGGVPPWKLTGKDVQFTPGAKISAGYVGYDGIKSAKNEASRKQRKHLQ